MNVRLWGRKSIDEEGDASISLDSKESTDGKRLSGGHTSVMNASAFDTSHDSSDNNHNNNHNNNTTNTAQPMDDHDDSIPDDGTISSKLSKKSKRSNNPYDATLPTKSIIFRNWFSRFLVIVAIALPTVLIVWVRAAQNNDLERDFQSMADAVLTGMTDKLVRTMAAMDSLSISITSQVQQQQQQRSWPQVTVWDYDYVGSSALDLSGALFMGFYPKVSSSKRSQYEQYVTQDDQSPLIHPSLWRFDQNTSEIVDILDDADAHCYYPLWQSVPIAADLINGDLQVLPYQTSLIQTMERTQRSALDQANSQKHNHPYYDTFYSKLLQMKDIQYQNEPLSWFYYPVFDSFQNESREMVGLIAAVLYWPSFFENASNNHPIHVVVENTCAEIFTIKVLGESVKFLGWGDHHDRKAKLKKSIDIENVENWTAHRPLTAVPLLDTSCKYSVHVYPTPQLQKVYLTPTPFYVAGGIFLLFILVGCACIYYDWTQRNAIRRIIRKSHTNRRVAEQFFPKRKLDETVVHRGSSAAHRGSSGSVVGEIIEDNNTGSKMPVMRQGVKSRLKSYLNDASTEVPSNPVADLFPFCTVLFADISGFSAWSSVHEPVQVFLLLESIFQLIDRLARRRNVFKVETIGDSYMAATGLPDPQPEHALIMARFARDCVSKVHDHLTNLETTLGPETGELRLKVGMHSGQVTAGFLGGQKTRFQLFGDTVNTAARITSTSAAGRIQVSSETAILLINNGKKSWLAEREDLINAKGKGIMTTYWLAQHNQRFAIDPEATTTGPSKLTSPVTDHKQEGDEEDELVDEYDYSGTGGGLKSGKGFTLPLSSTKAHQNRLVDWLADLLVNLLKNVVAQRQIVQLGIMNSRGSNNLKHASLPKKDIVLNEVVEAFDMPELKQKQSKVRSRLAKVDLSPEVKRQLRDFVAAISDRYHGNAFHNFGHCAHVTMASIKLLKRIALPDIVGQSEEEISREMHGHTYGITSDALAQFAVGFCALIHDVDHRGVPNEQLAKEFPALGSKYRKQSVAEQNSVDIAWNLLMHNQYSELQKVIFSTPNELKRFRQYVVNLVIATDIFNPRMKNLRNSRWKKAFEMGSMSKKNGADGKSSVNLKATIVLEHIIQAADVSHTMQHWHVYKKWNARLFNEMYDAFLAGRAKKDPSDGWYHGELWFFDNYIIPLARKLEQCGVFGVSSDECLNYAIENRKEWARQGKGIVKEMVENHVTEKVENVTAGFTQHEISAFTTEELGAVLHYLVAKGRKIKTFQAWDSSGQKSAAIAWLDALDIHDRCPAASKLNDRAILYSIYSGLYVCVRTGKILHHPSMAFERKLANRFLRDIHSYQGNDPIFDMHHIRALCLECEVSSLEGNFHESLRWSEDVEKIYRVEKHTLPMCKKYELDHSMLCMANRATWHWMLNDYIQATKAAKFILSDLLPNADPKNIMNSTMVFLPLFVLLRQKKRQGECARQLRDAFDERVIRPQKQGNLYSPALPMLKPVSVLLKILSSPEEITEEIIVWVVTDDEEDLPLFLNTAVAHSGICSSTIYMELCLRVAQSIQRKKSPTKLDRLRIDALVQKAKRQSAITESVVRGLSTPADKREIILEAAWKMHLPILEELHQFESLINFKGRVAGSAAAVRVSIQKPINTSLGPIVMSD